MMEKLDNVIDALECCLDGDEACPGCYLHDYAGCRDKLNFDVLELLREYRELLSNGDLISRSELIKKIFPYGMPDDGNYGINAKAVMMAIEGVKVYG